MNKDIYAISLNIVLPDGIKQQVSSFQSEIYKQYKDLRSRDNSPHLAVCTKFMVKEDIDRYIDLLVTELTDLSKFSITFTDLEISNKYILFNMDIESQKNILNINKRVKDITKDIGMETIDGLTPKYPNIPHISIVKLNKENIPNSFDLIQNKVERTTVNVNKLEITVEEKIDERFSEFTTTHTINLV